MADEKNDESARDDVEPAGEEAPRRGARSAEELLDAWYEQVSRESPGAETSGSAGGTPDRTEAGEAAEAR